MNAPVKWLAGDRGVERLVLLYPLAQLLHELEEWGVRPWHMAHNPNFPAALSEGGLRAGLLGVCALVAVWVCLALLPGKRGARALLLAPVLIIGLMNGLQHAVWTAVTATCAPGLVFGFFVQAPLVVLIARGMAAAGWAPPWVRRALPAAVALALVAALVAWDRLDPMLEGIMNFLRAVSS